MKTTDDQNRTLFEAAPIPLVEADFTKLTSFLGSDFKSWLQPSGSLADHQDLVRSWARQVESISANKAALTMFESCSHQDLAAEQFLTGTSQAIIMFVSFVDSLITGKSDWSGYTEIMTRSGKVRNARVSARIVVSETKKDIRVVFSFTDVTEQMIELKALRHANKVVSELTSEVRHDIVNQLLAILGYIELSLEESSLNTIYDFVKKERIAAESISRQIASTKAYQHLGESGPVWHKTGELIRCETDLPVPLAESKIFADPLISNVFIALVSVMKSQSGKSNQIHWSMESGEKEVRIICEVVGEGISIKDKERIFQRSWLGPLSLFPAREILGITGISIREEGKPGMTTRFVMTIPESSFSPQQH